MTCNEVRNGLDAYVDATLPRDAAVRIRAHLARCASCRSEERGLRALLERAAALAPSIDPPRDLWPHIDQRLDDSLRRGSGALPARTRTFPTYGLLAASLLLAGLAVGYFLWGVGPPPAPSADRPVAAQATPAAPARVRRTSEAERAIVEIKLQLRAALDEQRGSLSPETVRMVDHNLAIIEQAIGEIRVALERDPNNRELNRRLMAAHQSEVRLLQRATELATRL